MNYLIAFILCMNYLSLAGIPPLAGFFGKLFVYVSLGETGNFIFLFYMLVFSVVTSVYYLS